MAYDAALADRIRVVLPRGKRFEEKKMFEGVGYLLNGNMCVGIWKDSLIARLGPEQGEAALQEPYVKEFDITGRPRRMGDGATDRSAATASTCKCPCGRTRYSRCEDNS